MKDQRRNISIRLHLPGWVAEEVHDMWRDNAFLLARLVRDEAIIKGYCDSTSNESIQKGFAASRDIEDPKLFCLSNLEELRPNLLYIRDYLMMRKELQVEMREDINLKLSSLKELVALSKEYHEYLKTKQFKRTGKREDEEGAHIFYTFDNGWYWVNLKTHESREEGEQMGHCGRDYNTEIFSLRDKEGRSYVTASRFPTNGYINQIKGEYNLSPSKKYGYYIYKLLEQDEYPINGFSMDYSNAINTVRNYIKDLLKLDRFKSYSLSTVDKISHVIPYIDIKQFKENHISDILNYRKNSQLTFSSMEKNVEFYRSIIKEGYHKKEWFNWTWVILDLIYDKKSTKEDLEQLKEFNWFDDPNEDIGSYNSKKGSIIYHMMYCKRYDLILEFEHMFSGSFKIFHDDFMSNLKTNQNHYQKCILNNIEELKNSAAHKELFI